MVSALPPLTKVTVQIPNDLIAFLSEVHCRIEWHDETVTQLSDDMIQAPNIAPVIGGLCDVRARRFSFRYEANAAPRWHLCLFDNEIEDIAKMRVTTLSFLSLWKCSNSTCQDLFTYKADVYCNCNPNSRGSIAASVL